MFIISNWLELIDLIEIKNKKKAAKISGLKFYKIKNSPALLD